MGLKPQDVAVALKLMLEDGKIGYARLGKEMGLSSSMAHASVKRLIEAGLVDPLTRCAYRRQLRMFLIHGVPYAFAAKPKERTRGTPTAWAAPVMETQITGAPDSLPVWPNPDGKVKGVAVAPLYAGAVKAAQADQKLYALLALVDAVRIGKARERNLAERELELRMEQHETN